MQQFFFDIFLISRDVLPNHKLKLYNPFEFFLAVQIKNIESILGKRIRWGRF
jgi:hypothetical protein